MTSIYLQSAFFLNLEVYVYRNLDLNMTCVHGYYLLPYELMCYE